MKSPADKTTTRKPLKKAARIVTTGIVNTVVAPAINRRSGKALSSAALIQSIANGLPVSELDDLRSGLDISMEELIGYLGISKAGLHRRRKSQAPLTSDQSDRVIRYARLLGTAIQVMESPVLAREWLLTPQYGLGGVVPLSYAATEVGAREVEQLLGRIDHGIYA